MQPLEQSIRQLAAKLTGKPLAQVPDGELERVVLFMAENAAAGSGAQGEKGDAGASVTAITLTADADSKVTGGTATLSDNSTVPITVTVQ